MRRRGARKPIFTLIGVLLLITFSMALPVAGMYLYYGISEEVEFGDTMTLQGYVRDENGSGIPGADVTIIGSGLTSTTNANGEYEIQNAPTGIWRVRASTAGYGDDTQRLLIHESFTGDVNFELPERGEFSESDGLWFFFSLFFLTVILSGFVVAGAFYSFKRKRFAVVLVGSIFGVVIMAPALILTFLPLIFILGALGFFLSTFAATLVIINRKSFFEIQEEDELLGQETQAT